jgi:F-type H+-transporting ATPase subunit a
MASEQTSETGHQAAEQAFDPGASIMHHVVDANEIEIPFFPEKVIHLPELHIGGLDISITKHVVMMWIASAILVALFAAAARRKNDLVPRGLRGALEVMIVFIRDEVARKSIPQGADGFVSYLLTTFFFILTVNVLGMVPGMATATGNISVTATLALIAFAVIQFACSRSSS